MQEQGKSFYYIKKEYQCSHPEKKYVYRCSYRPYHLMLESISLVANAESSLEGNSKKRPGKNGLRHSLM
jgi:hypothetical protein